MSRRPITLVYQGVDFLLNLKFVIEKKFIQDEQIEPPTVFKEPMFKKSQKQEAFANLTDLGQQLTTHCTVCGVGAIGIFFKHAFLLKRDTSCPVNAMYATFYDHYVKLISL